MLLSFSALSEIKHITDDHFLVALNFADHRSSLKMAKFLATKNANLLSSRELQSVASCHNITFH